MALKKNTEYKNQNNTHCPECNTKTKKKIGCLGYIVIAFIIFFIIGIISFLSDETNKAPSEVTSDSSSIQTKTTPIQEYNGRLVLKGKAIDSFDGNNFLINPNVDKDGWTKCIINESGDYEFQHMQFPEKMGGSWYAYFGNKKISGNPKASSAGKIYHFNKGDIVEVNNVSVATFYKIKK